MALAHYRNAVLGKKRMPHKESSRQTWKEPNGFGISQSVARGGGSEGLLEACDRRGGANVGIDRGS